MNTGQQVGRKRELFARIISYVCETRAWKIVAIYSKENIFKLDSEWKGVDKMCVFQRKTGGERYSLYGQG